MSFRSVALCRFDEISEGSSRGFDPCGEGRDTIFIVRRRGELYGYRNSCPHWPGTPMAWRKDAYLTPDRTRIACYAHGAQFEIDSGVCLAGPCLGQSLHSVPVQVRENGTVEVLIKESEQE